MSAALAEDRSAALEAVAACERLAPRLIELVEHHAHAADGARPEWAGPHRDTFEERHHAVQRALLAGESWVLQVRHDALKRLAELALEAEAAALLHPSGPR